MYLVSGSDIFQKDKPISQVPFKYLNTHEQCQAWCTRPNTSKLPPTLCMGDVCFREFLLRFSVSSPQDSEVIVPTRLDSDIPKQSSMSFMYPLWFMVTFPRVWENLIPRQYFTGPRFLRLNFVDKYSNRLDTS